MPDLVKMPDLACPFMADHAGTDRSPRGAYFSEQFTICRFCNTPEYSVTDTGRMFGDMSEFEIKFFLGIILFETRALIGDLTAGLPETHATRHLMVQIPGTSGPGLSGSLHRLPPSGRHYQPGEYPSFTCSTSIRRPRRISSASKPATTCGTGNCSYSWYPITVQTCPGSIKP